MPRSFSHLNNWRLILVALVFIAPLCFASLHVGAQQKGKAALAGNSAQAQPKKTLTKLNTSETPEGSSLTITSDSALNDYSAYRSGDRFYVLIPEADASRVANGLRGRGFADVRAQKRGNDVLLSFRLLQGATARVSQKFNRLEIIITVPALVAKNAQTNTGNPTNTTNTSNPTNNTNPNIRTQPNNTTGGGNNTVATNPNQRTGGNSTQFNSGGANNSSANSNGSSSTNPIGTTPQTGGAQQNPIATNPNLNNQPAGIPVTPNGAVTQQGTEDVPPVNGANPLASPSASVPSDQVAQTLPNTPVNPVSTTNAPPGTTTNAPAPSNGSSLGAQIKQNWIVIAVAVVAALLIGWFVLARSRTESPVERRVESIRDAKATPVKAATAATPAIVAALVATPAPKVAAEPLVEPAVEPVELESEPAALESGPAASIAAPLAAELVSAPVVEEEEEAVEEETAHAKELEPVMPITPVVPVAPVEAAPVATDEAGDEVTSLLAGHSYDEAIINTQQADARQMVAAELLAALAGRNTVRHERARSAFIKYGYFDDATRTLRTAESPAERASAARSLGLVRDQSATPHLVAALEDDSAEVRRASVESLAEVRDPAAVAALESLRDREKDRRIPTALIQHAIEASVVGRMKVEPTQPITSPYATTPLTEPVAPETTPLPTGFIVEPPAPVEEAQAAEEEVVEAAAPPAVVETFEPQIVEEAAAPQVVEEAAAPQIVEAETEAVAAPAPELIETPTIEAAPVESAELESEAIVAPLIPEEVAPQIEVETPAPVALEDAVAEAEPVQLVPESVIEAAPLETPVPVPEETPAPVATAEPVVEHTDGTASDWIDVDVSAPEPVSQAAPPAAPVEAAALTDLPAPEAVAPEAPPQAALPLMESVVEAAPVVAEPVAASLSSTEERGIEVVEETFEPSKELDVVGEDASNVPSVILRRLASEDASERVAAVGELGRIGGDDSFREISASFDDPSSEVRNAAARALYNLNPDRAASFTRALREAPPERRRHIGAALASSGLATEAIGHLMGESREKTYDAFSLLFLMSKAGEVQPLMRAVEEHPNNEVRLAVVKLLALSGQQEILPAFRRLAVRGSLPTEVRSAVMEAIYQISSQTPGASA